MNDNYRDWVWEGLGHCLREKLYLTGWSTAEKAMRARALRAEESLDQIKKDLVSLDAKDLREMIQWVQHNHGQSRSGHWNCNCSNDDCATNENHEIDEAINDFMSKWRR
jgi:hypothetical protein